MDFLNLILNVAQPTGVWATIINAFESGVGSYLLAIVLITLIVRVIMAPFDVVNKKISKKQANAQAKLQPEIEKLQKKYGNDKALLNQKTQELYKKNGMSVGGSCLFMLIFMAINLTVFFTLFSSLNAMADYKINQQYLALKDSYSNVLNLVDNYREDKGNLDVFGDYENVSFAVEIEGEKSIIKAFDKNNNEIYKSDYISDFSRYNKTTKTLEAGEITSLVKDYKTESTYTKIEINEGTAEEPKMVEYYILSDKVVKNENTYTINEVVDVYKFTTSDEYILSLVRTYTSKEEVQEGQQAVYNYIGDTIITGETTVKDAIQSMGMKEVVKTYNETQKENSFLWIGSIWIADSPLKSSIFTFDQYKNEIGKSNVSAQEEAIYNSFMNDLRVQKGRVNGYFILAIISIGVSFLSMWLGQRGNKAKANPGQKSTKITMFIMPIIMGIFSLLYNSVFAIYLVVSQAISAAIAPLSNLIVKKWEEHDKKKEESKQQVVDYRRK